MNSKKKKLTSLLRRRLRLPTVARDQELRSAVLLGVEQTPASLDCFYTNPRGRQILKALRMRMNKKEDDEESRIESRMKRKPRQLKKKKKEF
jgi:predicted RNA binding protein with dsRBD fold (UPF0201 family)